MNAEEAVHVDRHIHDLLAQLKQVSHDNESAHVTEDTIWHTVLSAIEQGYPSAPNLARLALQTIDVDFERWYA